MHLTLDDTTVLKLQEKLDEKTTPTKILFDLDDGVGPLSKFGSCSMHVHFRFVLVDEDVDLSTYDEVLETNAFEMLLKGYSKIYINGDNLRTSYQKNFATIQLKTDNELVDANCEIVDFRK